MIPNNILKKYGVPTFEEYQIADKTFTKEMFYRTFLIETDFIANKILEGVATSEEYADELYYREVARREISGVTEERAEQKPLDTRIDGIERPTNIMLGT